MLRSVGKQTRVGLRFGAARHLGAARHFFWGSAPEKSIMDKPKYAESVTELIGKTPMIKLQRVIGDDCKAAKVLVKLEMENPGGSVKGAPPAATARPLRRPPAGAVPSAAPLQIALLCR